MPDHIHLLVCLNPSTSVSEFVQKIKANSSKHINDEEWFPGKFNWSDGYGAFSVSQSRVETVTKYITNQEEHHQKHKLDDEMQGFVKAHNLKSEGENSFWTEQSE